MAAHEPQPNAENEPQSLQHLLQQLPDPKDTQVNLPDSVLKEERFYQINEFLALGFWQVLKTQGATDALTWVLMQRRFGQKRKVKEREPSAKEVQNWFIESVTADLEEELKARLTDNSDYSDLKSIMGSSDFIAKVAFLNARFSNQSPAFGDRSWLEDRYERKELIALIEAEYYRTGSVWKLDTIIMNRWNQLPFHIKGKIGDLDAIRGRLKPYLWAKVYCPILYDLCIEAGIAIERVAGHRFKV